MTYTVKFTVLRDGQKRTLTTNVAGCADEPDAHRKVLTLYTGVQKIVSVTPLPVKG